MFEQLWAELVDIDVEAPLIGSLVAGAIIGFEREFQGKAAGLRTHTLVCFAAALLTIAGLRMAEWQVDLPLGTQVVSDMSRMPHAIMTGVGFLGAGVIFRDGVNVQGLTTAATLWLTAAIGVVFGTGLFGLAVLSTLIALLVLVALRLFHKLTAPQPELTFELTVPIASSFSFDRLAQSLAEAGLVSRPISYQADNASGELIVKAAVGSKAAPIQIAEVLKQIEASSNAIRVKVAHLD